MTAGRCSFRPPPVLWHALDPNSRRTPAAHRCQSAGPQVLRRVDPLVRALGSAAQRPGDALLHAA
eukprot:3601478-Prymnesium_polylepis.1